MTELGKPNAVQSIIEVRQGTLRRVGGKIGRYDFLPLLGFHNLFTIRVPCTSHILLEYISHITRGR